MKIKSKKDFKRFVVFGDSGMQMFHWLSPYIEEAGYSWNIKERKHEIGSFDIEINPDDSRTA